MLSNQLEEAIEYRDRLKAILIFKKGCFDGAWLGPVECRFGSYVAELSMRCVGEELKAAFDAEERQLRNTLDILGVDFEEPKP